jgi:2-oxoglutarate dehydrogenase E1 component
MNIQVPEQKRWHRNTMEPEANNWPLDRETRMRTLRSVMAGEEFEHFLHSRFVGRSLRARGRQPRSRSWKRF